MHNKTIAELSQGLAKGEYSSVELTQDFLQRIKRLDGQYNAFISVKKKKETHAYFRQRSDEEAPPQAIERPRRPYPQYSGAQ